MSPETKRWLIDAAGFVGLLGLPHAATGWSRAALAGGALAIWVLVFRPTWRGLSGPFFTLALFAQAALLVGVAAW